MRTKLFIAGLLAASAFLTPVAAPAQTVASSFDELRRVLKTGQTVIVTDTGGRQIKGKVSDVGSSALVILIPQSRTFAESSVMEIEGTDSLWNGALLGAGIGTGFAMWDYLIDPSEPGNGAIFTVAIGLGTAIGAAIDKLLTRGLLYRAPPQMRNLKISALTENERRGVLVSVRF